MGSEERKRSFLGLIIIIIMQLAIPTIVARVWYAKTKCSQKPLRLGIIGYLCSFIIQKFLIFIVKLFANSKGITAYAFETALPGIFEEIARYICFYFFIFKKSKKKNTSVDYGIGHGGMVSIVDAFYFSYKFFFSKDKDRVLSLCLLNVVEKTSKFFYNISLSVMVYKSLRDGNLLYFFLAIIFHMIIDFFDLMGEEENINNYAVAIIMLAITLASVGFAYYLYMNMKDPIDENVDNKSSEKIEKINDTDDGKKLEEGKS